MSQAALADSHPSSTASREDRDTEETATTATTATTTPATSLEATELPESSDVAAPPIGNQDVSDLAAYARQASASAAETGAGQKQPSKDDELRVDGEGVEEKEEEEDAAQEERGHEDASYWDADAMAPLSAKAAAAVARLRAYRAPPFPLWDRLPASRRAAVLLLLYADRRGDLRIVITMRAASLRSYSGHAAFPGGKADDVHETPYQIARREAFEEIGLPASDDRLPKPFRIEQLCELPCNIAQTDIVVRPCVAFLHVDKAQENAAKLPGQQDGQAEHGHGATSDEGAQAGESPYDHGNYNRNDDGSEDVTAETMIPRLDAKEVAAVFSAPFHNFLLATDEQKRISNTNTDAAADGARSASSSGLYHRSRPLPPGHWYDGRWITFRDAHPWRVHNFHVPVDSQRVRKPPPEPALPQGNLAEELGREEERVGRYKVWGMTAHILVDAARLAYDETPEFEHNPHHGDEGIIVELDKEGRFFDKKRKLPADEHGRGGGAAEGQGTGNDASPGKKPESAKM